MPLTQQQSRGIWKVYALQVSPTRPTLPPLKYSLQVREDCSFTQLHTYLQHSFGWQDDELWSFSNETGAAGTASACEFPPSARISTLLQRQADDLLYQYGLPQPQELWLRTERIFIKRDAPMIVKSE